MSCTTESGARCTKCCEALHIRKRPYLRHIKGETHIKDGERLFGKNGIWEPISKRRAKKITPYLLDAVKRVDPNYIPFVEDINKGVYQFFRCRILDKEKGCPLHDSPDLPYTCEVYKGGYEYSPTCTEDIKRIPAINIK